MTELMLSGESSEYRLLRLEATPADRYHSRSHRTRAIGLCSYLTSLY